MSNRFGSMALDIKKVATILFILALCSLIYAAAADTAVANKSPRDIYNCGNFDYQEDAQAILEEGPGDPNRFDRDNDGVACEKLPKRPEPLPGPDRETPLIFIPGIAGSELRDLQGNEKWPRGQEIYDSEEDKFLLDVGLDENGNETIETEPGDILRTVQADTPTPLFDDSDVYQTTIETLTGAGYVENEDLFVFPFDWRKDVESQGKNELIARIDDVRNKTEASRVDIMAHSQGGLVTLAALRDTDSIGKVRKVVTLGTPLLGSTKSLGLLEYKEGCFGFKIPFGDCVINSDTTQQIMKYMSGVYQLLPSRKFDGAVGAPLTVDLGSEEDGEKFYDEWTQEVASSLNVDAGLLTKAGEFHKRYDVMAWADPSVELVRIAGTGLSTPTSILKFNECNVIFFSCEVSHGYIEEETGDGTVPEGSAAPGAAYDSIDRAPTVYAPGIEHGELAQDQNVLGAAILFFRPGPQQPDAETFGAASAKISNTPQPFDGVKLEAMGPVRGYVGDETGNVIGNYLGKPEDITSQGIPGGSYNASADSDYQSFFLNGKGSYTSEFEVVDRSSVQLEARTYSQSQAKKVAVFRVRVPDGAKLRTEFATDQNPDSLRLNIDRDGDGTTDRVVAPDSTAIGPAARETDPPNTAANSEVVSEGRAIVTLSARDGREGSGIADTYYMLQGDTRSRLYTEPFAAPSGTVVRFLSVDKAGNMERVKKAMADGTL